jgi:hypothetical protein
LQIEAVGVETWAELLQRFLDHLLRHDPTWPSSFGWNFDFISTASA